VHGRNIEQETIAAIQRIDLAAVDLFLAAEGSLCETDFAARVEDLMRNARQEACDEE
jgi:hypothetical protein